MGVVEVRCLVVITAVMVVVVVVVVDTGIVYNAERTYDVEGIYYMHIQTSNQSLGSLMARRVDFRKQEQQQYIKHTMVCVSGLLTVDEAWWWWWWYYKGRLW